MIRRFQPDVIILRFSGTPRDGHGHHQASAILGKEAFTAAADAARFPEQLRWVKPWQAKRVVWNAFSFTPEQEAELAKAKNKIQVDAGAYDPVLGCSYGEIAGISRSQHRSQGMGAPQSRGPALNYFLPVLGEAMQHNLLDGVDTSWGRVPGGAAGRNLLERAAAAYSSEHPEKIIPVLVRARYEIARLASSGSFWATQKLDELDRTLALCSGLWMEGACSRFSASPGASVDVTLTAIKRVPADVRWKAFTVAGLGQENRQEVNANLEANVPLTRKLSVTIPPAAPFSQPFWLAAPNKGFDYSIADQQLIGRPDPEPVLRAGFDLEIAGAQVHLTEPVRFRYVDHQRGELTRPFEVVPPVAVNLPERVVIFATTAPRRIMVQVKANSGASSGAIKLDVPAGWAVSPESAAFHLDAEGEQQEIGFSVGRAESALRSDHAEFRAVASVSGREVSTGMQPIAYEHIPPQTIFRPSQGILQRVSLNVLARNVGYVMGAGDDVPDAIRQMGCTVTLLDETDLLRGDLSRFDAIVTGVRAYNVRSDLRGAEQRILDYVHDGGTLVVQYNVLEYARFGGPALPMGQLGPYPFEVSRDRVVEEDSPITLTDPMSPLLRAPNEIGSSDFLGWIQERGLYFANKWDAHYKTVLATHDTGEKDLPGGTLYTRYGKGTYIFTAYSWFRELPAGVPGAYRLFANLLSAGKTLK